MSERLLIRAGTLITPRCTCERVTIIAQAGLIWEILPGFDPRPGPGDTLIDATERIVGPGLIDLHVHGGGGYDAMDATAQAIEGLAAFHARHGTTSLLPSTMAAPPGEYHHVLQAIGEAMGDPTVGARVLGAHVEGPFLSEGKRGAHPARYVRPPEHSRDPWLFEHLAAIRRITLAPELPGALELTRELRRSGVLISLGHTTAGEDLITQAVLAGATHVTHLFNAMSSVEKVGPLRRVGLAEMALACDDLSVELIADGWHVPVPMMQFVVKAKGPERVALITDASRAAGLPEGRYLLGAEGDQFANVRGGMAVTDEGGLAGSIVTMDELLRNAVRRIGLPLTQAWQMASLTPARILGADRLGEVAVGKRADLLVLDRELEVVATIVGGRVVYERNR